jgi:hypothetical protein
MHHVNVPSIELSCLTYADIRGLDTTEVMPDAP